MDHEPIIDPRLYFLPEPTWLGDPQDPRNTTPIPEEKGPQYPNFQPDLLFAVAILRFDALNPKGVVEHVTNDKAEASSYLTALRAQAGKQDSYFRQTSAQFRAYVLLGREEALID